MKIAPLIAIVSLMAAASSSAAIMSESAFGGASDLLVLNSSGALVSSGLAASGFFSISDAEVTADLNAGKFSDLFATFTPIVSDNFVQGGTALTSGTPVPGFYATGNTSFDPTAYIGKTIYTFITDGSSLVSPGSNYILLSFGGKLSVAADPVAPPPTTYNVFAGDGTILLGQKGPVVHSDVAGGDFNTLQFSVPEPSVALLGLLGVAGLVRRRR